MRERLLGPILREENAADVARKVLASIHAADANLSAMVDSMAATSNAMVPSGPTLGVAAKRFLDNRLHSKGRSGHTIDDYRRSLNGLQAILGNIRVAQITAKDIRSFRDCLATSGLYRMRNKFDDLKAGRGDRVLSHRTVVKHIKNVRTFFGWCLKEELIEKKPGCQHGSADGRSQSHHASAA